MNNQVSETMILRDEDGAFIPLNPDNTDYQEYLAWLDEGNEPTIYTPPNTTLPAPPTDTEGEDNGTDTPSQSRDPSITVIASGGGTFEGDKHSRPAKPPAAKPATPRPAPSPSERGRTPAPAKPVPGGRTPGGTGR
jgi:hypothetical protein